METNSEEDEEEDGESIIMSNGEETLSCLRRINYEFGKHKKMRRNLRGDKSMVLGEEQRINFIF